MSESNGAGLTPRQRDALAVIARYTAANRCSPSLQEIADALGMKSKSNAHRLIQGLKERGAVRVLLGHGRSIQIVGPTPTHPASTELVQAVERLLDNIRREDPEAGFAVVDADALGALDIAYREYLESAETPPRSSPRHEQRPHG